MHSYINIVAFHLDTLDMQNMDVQHAVLELNHKMVFGGHPGPRSEGPKAENNINTNLVLSSGKPRCTSYYLKL